MAYNVDATMILRNPAQGAVQALRDKGMRVVEAHVPGDDWIVQVPASWQVNARQKWAKNPATGEEFNLKEFKA